MNENPKQPQASMFSRIKDAIMETDIHILVFTPPIIGFGGLFVWAFLVTKLTGQNIHPPLSYIAIGIASLITCLSGLAEIYKKEMPGPFGGTIQGSGATISGLLLLILFGLVGGFILLRGLVILLSGA